MLLALQGLSTKAEQLLVVSVELKELRQEHGSLNESLQALQQQLDSTSQKLAEAQ